MITPCLTATCKWVTDNAVIRPCLTATCKWVTDNAGGAFCFIVFHYSAGLSLEPSGSRKQLNS